MTAATSSSLYSEQNSIVKHHVPRQRLMLPKGELHKSHPLQPRHLNLTVSLQHQMNYTQIKGNRRGSFDAEDGPSKRIEFFVHT